MANHDKSEQEPAAELWHMYAAEKGGCPDTWNRELEEWQLDGVTADSEPGRKCQTGNPLPCSGLSALQQELVKWLPAT